MIRGGSYLCVLLTSISASYLFIIKLLVTYLAKQFFSLNCSGSGKIRCELTPEELRALRVLHEDTFVDQFF